jgi:ribulose-phosphate 3-epimerase
MNEPKISASILSANFAHLGEEVMKLEKSGADMIHFDIMDGHFVPNLTFGPRVVESVRNKTMVTFDTHLMISNPENYIEKFADAGSDYITVHAESTTHLDRLIEQIKRTGKRAGVSIVPNTNEDILKYVIYKVDLILVMTVNPGFGGQEFIESQVAKIGAIRRMIDSCKREVLLSVDGGINPDTAKICTNAGADVLVSGAYIFANDDYRANIKSLRA